MNDLYQQVILDHNRQPRNVGAPEGANLSAEGHNPLCGDTVTLYLKVDGDTVVDVGFEGAGCAIATASASLLTEVLRGKSVSQAHELVRGMLDLLTGDPMEAADASRDLGKLAVFSGVREYPMRVKCATLVWHTLNAALQDRRQAVSKD
jgi:nitrogen fixation NifU-like protein